LEDEKMKTSEMIAMLEKNPKLKFKRKGWSLNDDIYVSASRNKVIDFFNTTKNHVFFIDKDDWQLVRESVPVWEAVKAYTEGKNITCEYTDNYERTHKFTLNHSDNTVFAEGILARGKWYIEDSPNA